MLAVQIFASAASCAFCNVSVILGSIYSINLIDAEQPSAITFDSSLTFGHRCIPPTCTLLTEKGKRQRGEEGEGGKRLGWHGVVGEFGLKQITVTA